VKYAKIPQLNDTIIYFCPKNKQSNMLNAIRNKIRRLKAGCATVFCGLSLLSLPSCGPSAEKEPDVSQVKVALSSRRLDRDLVSLDINNLAAGLTRLQQRYPDFLNFYLDTLMGFGINGHYNDSSQAIQLGLKRFLTFKDYKELFDTVYSHYPDTKSVETDLAKGFQYMKHYYPDFRVPGLVYFVSSLANWGVVSYDGVIGIGLDMFLGERYPFYRSVGQPDYMFINFRQVSIAPSVFSTLYNDRYPFQEEDKTLLAMMINKGKQQYFVAHMLPFVNAEDRIGYTRAQWEWCEANEGMIYNFFVSRQLMYEKNWQKVMRYVTYGPGSSGMPSEAPGNIGAWLGWRIVSAYAERHPELSLDQVCKEEQAEKILKEAKYKPK
jgi:hypothetical protein